MPEVEAAGHPPHAAAAKTAAAAGEAAHLRKDIHRVHVLVAAAAAAAPAVDLLDVHAGVVLLLLLRVGEDVERLANLLETLLRLLALLVCARRVPVGVPLHRALPVPLLDLALGRVLADADHLVQVLAQALLELELGLPQRLRDAAVVGLELLRLLIVGNRLVVLLQLESAGGAPQHRLEVPPVDAESRVAVSDGARVVALFELCGRAVGVEGEVEVEQVRVELDRLRVEADRLVVPARAEGAVAPRLERLELLDLQPHLPRGRVVRVEPQRLGAVLERLLQLPRRVQRLAAHGEQVRLLAVRAEPAGRLGEDLRRALLRPRLEHSLHLQASHADRARALVRQGRESHRRLASRLSVGALQRGAAVAQQRLEPLELDELGRERRRGAFHAGGRLELPPRIGEAAEEAEGLARAHVRLDEAGRQLERRLRVRERLLPVVELQQRGRAVERVRRVGGVNLHGARVLGGSLAVALLLEVAVARRLARLGARLALLRLLLRAHPDVLLLLLRLLRLVVVVV
mmetsp:Transcript_22608/g.72888  ORF Transcript_22608/g.72888 Transcript_22608/m.72888 type:complete len:517 (+) Transcript_22608:516-2066(+)